MDTNIYDPQEVRALFNQMSKTYEQMNYISSFGFSERWRRQMLHSLPTHAGELKIIDLMTGMGEMWALIRKKYPQAQISALDFSENMLAYAQKRNLEQFKNTVEVLHQDLLQNSLPAEGYDCVVCAFGLKTFDEAQLRTLARETRRILKKGGTFAFVEVSSPPSSFLRFWYRLYLKRIIPLVGKIFLGNPENYKMLWRYTEQFQNAQQVLKIFAEEGLQTRYQRFFFGCATGVSGEKM